jgi:hypothetical protein
MISYLSGLFFINRYTHIITITTNTPPMLHILYQN